MAQYRTHWCGQVGKGEIGRRITVCGWVRRIRKLGSLTFIDIADRSGLVQGYVIEQNAAFEAVNALTRESVVRVEGTLQVRKERNPELPTGEYEIEIDSLSLLSKAKTPPLIAEDQTDALEEARLQYRYIDLRRPVMQQNLIFRSKFVNAFRQHLIAEDFVEIETPILTKSTPFGAKDYLVPTRSGKAAFFALPQSPQIYKQLLMVAGMERYFQVARCFRDEDMRSDRQPEFTQLDLEMSFCSMEQIQQTVEKAMVHAFAAVGFNLPTRFARMTFEQAVNQYGTDKPDLRFGHSLEDVTKVFKDSNVRFLSSAERVKCIQHPGRLDKKQVVVLEKFAKDNGASGLAWVYFRRGVLEDGSISKLVEKDKIEWVIKQNASCSTSQETTVLIVAGTNAVCNQALGAVRTKLRDMLNLALPNMLAIAWITEWPLFERDETTGTYQAAHHPFTSPAPESMADFETNRDLAKASAYDIVLNGYEIGGGSVRISDPDVQRRMFKAIGMSEQSARSMFGFILDAFSYGVPPHGGIALGIDRIVMILRNQTSIREVIAFPKNSTGNDLMMSAPGPVDENRLSELRLKKSE